MRGRLAGAAALLATLVLAAPAVADTKVVSFDNLVADTPVADQYKDSHGISFRGPDAGDGWFPVVRSAPGLAHSGSQVADVSTCTAPNCEGFFPRSIGRLTTLASKVAVNVGYLGSEMPAPTAQITLTAYDAGGGTIGSQSTTVTQGQPFTQQLSVSAPGGAATIASIEVAGPQFTGGIAMDDIEITRPDPAPGEPPPAPDFSMSVTADPINVPEGDAVSVPVSINRINGSNGDITLLATGLPSGVSAAFSPNPVPATETQATMTVTAATEATATTDYSEATITATPSPGAGSTDRAATKLMRVVGNCVREVRADFIDARSTACMRTSGSNRVVATSPVRFDGLLLEPQDSGRLVIDTANRTVTSEGKDVRVSPADHTRIKISEDPVDWDLKVTGDDVQVIDSPTSLALNEGGEEPLVDLFVFFRVERITVALTRAGKAQVLPTLKLGFWPFNYFGSGTTTQATTGFSTDNDHGSSFDALGFKLDKVTALGIELKNVSLLYQAGGTLSGGATLVLRLAKPYEISAGFGLKRGDFDFLRGSVSGLNQPVSTGVFLQRLGFEVQRNPLSLQGSAAFSAGPQIKGVQFVTVNGTFKAILDDPFVVELNGTANLIEKYFGTRFQLANAFVRYTSTGLFEFGGSHNWDLKVAYAKGNVSGFVDGLDAASIEGSEKVCISVPFISDPCGGAALIASTIGIAACANVVIGNAGIGYAWGGDFDLWWGSCDLSPWRPVPGSAMAADTVRSFTLRPGMRSAAFAVDGDGGPPDVTLTGPRGEKISVSSASPQARKGSLSAIQVESGTTYLLVKRPSAGTWKLSHDGGPAVRGVRQAFGIPAPSVKARVEGRGLKRVLRWQLRAIPGQRVRFVETGRDVRNVIATTRASRGRVRFRPADGPAGKRRIVAMVEQNGLPRKTLTAGSYRAPGTLKPKRPTRARIVRRGSRVVVSWHAPLRRFRHAVAVHLGDGRDLVLIAAARASQVSVPDVPRGAKATATIMGLTQANGRGPAAKVTLAPSVPLPTRGRWKLARAFDYVAGGRFDIRDRSLSGLRVKPGPSAASACGTAELRVAGKRPLSRSTRDGLMIWNAGKHAVRVLRGTTRLSGTLDVSFSDARHGTGELLLPGCRLYFETSR